MHLHVYFTIDLIPQEQERMGECLLAERDRFMQLLGRERRERGHLEAFACSRIQAAYRGYMLRKRCVIREFSFCPRTIH